MKEVKDQKRKCKQCGKLCMHAWVKNENQQNEQIKILGGSATTSSTIVWPSMLSVVHNHSGPFLFYFVLGY